MTLFVTITKYIDIESNTREKLYHFLTELQNTDLTTNLNQNPFSNPNKYYDTFINILTDIKQRVLHLKKLNLTQKIISILSG